jgi:hypothetical protein
MAKFLVNTLSEDGLTGETNRMDEILHNLMIIGPKYREGFMQLVEETNLPYIVQICVCGRYITYIEVTKNLKEGVMRFYDLKNDNDLALDAAMLIGKNWYTPAYFNWFMEVFEMLKPVYSDNYDAAELIVVENAGLLLN